MSDEKTTAPESNPAEGAPQPQAEPETVQVPRAELEGLRAKVDEYLKMAQRVQADFSNYQKRVARDREEAARYLVEKLLLDLLPALDAFSLAVKSGGASAEQVLKGMQLAEREIFRKLEQHGLKRVPAEGLFDPAFQEAVIRKETEEAPEGTILQELRPAYTLHDRLLRPAQVSVAAKPSR